MTASASGDLSATSWASKHGFQPTQTREAEANEQQRKAGFRNVSDVRAISTCSAVLCRCHCLHEQHDQRVSVGVRRHIHSNGILSFDRLVRRLLRAEIQCRDEAGSPCRSVDGQVLLPGITAPSRVRSSDQGRAYDACQASACHYIALPCKRPMGNISQVHWINVQHQRTGQLVRKTEDGSEFSNDLLRVSLRGSTGPVPVHTRMVRLCLRARGSHNNDHDSVYLHPQLLALPATLSRHREIGNCENVQAINFPGP